MPTRFDPKIRTLPPAQQEIWQQLAPAPAAGFVLYGGTAIALHLGHRDSIDFDFFSALPLDKKRLAGSFAFMREAKIVQESADTLIAMAEMPSGHVKVSYFGKIGFGHINEPLRTSDDVLLVASLEDLLATKLKAILDRAEVKDYRDIAAMIEKSVSLERGLAGFGKMFNADPVLPLKALGFFEDGDLPSIATHEQNFLRAARDRVSIIPVIELKPGLQSAGVDP